MECPGEEEGIGARYPTALKSAYPATDSEPETASKTVSPTGEVVAPDKAAARAGTPRSRASWAAVTSEYRESLPGIGAL